MTPSASNQAWCVSLANHLEKSGGGVQVCTQEYLRAIELAGWTISPKPFQADRRPVARLQRALTPAPFAHILSPSYLSDLRRDLAAAPPGAIFFNQVDTAPAAVALRASTTRPFVLLSHGAKIVDELHARRLGSPTPSDRTLGQTLRRESELRTAFDHVFTLSAEECIFESWLGARRVSWLPRIVAPDALDWQPVAGRVGFVGTLDHPPNLAGLRDVLCALRNPPASFRVRLVGGSVPTGQRLAAEFPCIDYLGPLDQPALRQEAASWSCFLHPLFLLARGCSTKLSQALGWGLPVLTTATGCRGYRLDPADLVQVGDANLFAQRALELADPAVSAPLRTGVERAAKSAPSLAEVAQMMRTALAALPSS